MMKDKLNWKGKELRSSVSVLVFVLLSLLIATPGHAAPLAISSIYIEPTGYEDPSTHEWKGSYWVITATTNTKEEYLLYQFNETESGSFGQNKIDNKTIVPTATIKITITPRQPYWEIPLKKRPYMVYPETYGTDIHVLTKDTWKVKEISVPALYANVLESYGYWVKHTPFKITVEKIGSKPFTKTIDIDTIGGTETVVMTNPADTLEKLMITNLGQLDTGYSSPPFSMITVFNKTGEFIMFNGEDVRKAIQYGRNETSGVYDNCYAFYWFGGGNIHRTKQGYEVQYWPEDNSPAHYIIRQDPLGRKYNSPVEDYDFPGSYRADYWDRFGFRIYRILPIPADIFNDNLTTNPTPGRSLVAFLNESVSPEINPDVWYAGCEIVSIGESLKLRINLPFGATSSLITIRASTELADSIVYQPIVGNGKIEQAFWDSTKTTKSSIKDNDIAVLKVKQYASKASKITVTPSIPANVPVSVSPLMDSAIVDPNSMHAFQFEIRNLGPQVNQSSTVTFTITNDLGTVTDTVTLDFNLLVIENPQPNPNPPPEGTGLEGDPLWIWLTAVISITVATASVYGVYTYRSSRKRTLGKKEQNQ
jgi:hypothetical protein